MGANIDTATCRFTWNATLDQLGEQLITISATDLTNLTTTQTFVLRVLDSYPPVAAFDLATGLSASAKGSILSAPGTINPSVLLNPGNTTLWYVAGTANVSIAVDLEGELSHRLDRVTLTSPQAPYGARHFELWAGDSLTDLTSVVSGELPNDAKPHTFTFAPVEARVIRLFLLDNYGDPTYVGLLGLDVRGPPRLGGVVSYAAAGATVVRSPSHPAGPAIRLLDFDDPSGLSGLQTEWLTNTVPARPSST